MENLKIRGVIVTAHENFTMSSSGKITLSSVASPSDCLGKLISRLGGDPTAVSIAYKAADDSIVASAEGTDVPFSKKQCK